jgi:putative endonuclease
MTKRMQSYRFGLWAEYWAAARLMLKGYRILALRYKTPHGEIDIVARKGQTLVMIEVKARAQAEDGLYAIRPQARQRIENAARYFLSGNPQYSAFDVRFDVVTISPAGGMTHLDNAWRPGS